MACLRDCGHIEKRGEDITVKKRGKQAAEWMLSVLMLFAGSSMALSAEAVAQEQGTGRSESGQTTGSEQRSETGQGTGGNQKADGSRRQSEFRNR